MDPDKIQTRFCGSRKSVSIQINNPPPHRLTKNIKIDNLMDTAQFYLWNILLEQISHWSIGRWTKATHYRSMKLVGWSSYTTFGSEDTWNLSRVPSPGHRVCIRRSGPQVSLHGVFCFEVFCRLPAWLISDLDFYPSKPLCLQTFHNIYDGIIFPLLNHAEDLESFLNEVQSTSSWQFRQITCTVIYMKQG